MTVIEVIKKKSRPGLGQIMKNQVSNRYCLSLLRFFMAHPNGRFSRLAIIHAIDEDGSRLGVEKALEQLVSEGILKTDTENHICYYLLTGNEPMRQLVLNMAEFDWRQWQLVLEHR